ncbi:hypothetical protein Ctob_013181 [Chrysochromulina tobinii]|uniref:Sel1 domain protein repeat-containing protein n=1 Tax=Chrysochromulina tobinii TaxID=1460289 RepID=A0A0M0KAG2_9EUKA|nr:hypothetical protein Ctob_013181 [Chrysochromulina tobinii]|eukprot:KOO35831.1 hypothetical protein Ctob_013181 [Chrysochromulina sp. CCMP291]
MVRKDPVRAAAFYRQAADQGHAKAKVNLGIFLYTATVPGSKTDKAGAEALWKEAHEDGVPEAEMCLRNMTLDVWPSGGFLGLMTRSRVSGEQQ